MPRLLRNRSLLIVITLLAAGVVGWQWRTRNGHNVAFTTAPVKRGDLTSTITATGTIEPVEVIDVGAQVAGLIRSFGKDRNGNPIDYGSVVEEGTILAKIDDSVYTADLSLAKAQVEQDQAGELRRRPRPRRVSNPVAECSALGSRQAAVLQTKF
jgi:HlyD family secretion protein